MKSTEVLLDIQKIARGPNPSTEIAVLEIALRILADRVYQIELADGRRVRDVMDCRELLVELADSIRNGVTV